uniref:NR LBD domain-containing protein n=1 Tax=Ditylenchus dipsaci TaxID=166011 RepID=A0A915E6Z1_9BILA
MQKDICSVVMDPLKRVKLSVEEYVLLKALIFSNSVYIDDICISDRILLQRESERYSKILLHHLQAKMGILSGAKKFADITSLFSSLSKASQQMRQMHVFYQCTLQLENRNAPFIDEVMFV